MGRIFSLVFFHCPFRHGHIVCRIGNNNTELVACGNGLVHDFGHMFGRGLLGLCCFWSYKGEMMKVLTLTYG